MTNRPENPPRTVVISEQHVFTPYITVGGHQYARIFAQHGWNVAVISGSFSAARLLRRDSKVPAANLGIWNNGGREVERRITNFCFAHLLPRRIRYNGVSCP